MKKCNYCHVLKELGEFPLKKDGIRSGNCLSCKEKRKIYNDKNKETISEKKQSYYASHKDDILKTRKEYYKENKNAILARNKVNYEENKEEYLQYKKQYYLENKEHYLELSKKDRIENPAKYLLKNAKKRAKDKNLPIDITIEDIIIPEICPVLGIPLVIGNSLEERDSSPSLDRIIPELGYVKGNIKVISFKANSLKKDGNIEDFEKVINYIKGK